MSYCRRLAPFGAAAVALAVAGSAAAAPVPATIRVEGDTTTIIPEQRQATSETNVAGRDGAVRTIPGPTALGQLIRAGAKRRLPVRTSFTDDFGPLAGLVERIGPDDQGRNFEGPKFWLFKVNHVSSPVAANQATLKRGDEVLWYFTANFFAAELDLAVPRRPVRAGKRFTVTVTAYDGDGNATPANGAKVAYRNVTRTTNRRGRATFTAVDGRGRLRATRADDIRSASEPLCVYATSPGECSPTRPYGGSLRLVLGGQASAGWTAVAPALRTIADLGVPVGVTAALAWRGRVFRGRAEVRNAARALVRRYLA